MKNIAIFASGSGTNAEKIFEYFKERNDVNVAMLFSNNPKAAVLKRADKFNIPTKVFDKHSFYESDEVLDLLREQNIDLIVLAGFLWLIPKPIIRAFKNRIINIHPALLPKYGGKGMYGMRVHEAVIKNKDRESGITIHFVNEYYDDGSIVYQTVCKVDREDTPESLADKVHALEHKFLPSVIDDLLKNLD